LYSHKLRQNSERSFLFQKTESEAFIDILWDKMKTDNLNLFVNESDQDQLDIQELKGKSKIFILKLIPTVCIVSLRISKEISNFNFKNK
jgi:hypothetical protein